MATKRLLIITGLPRSGTSAAASIALGLNIPMALPGNLSKAAADLTEHYPHGTVEDTAFRDIVNSLTDIPVPSGYTSDEHAKALRLMRKVYRSSLRHHERVWVHKWLQSRKCEERVIGVKLPAVSFIIEPLIEITRQHNIEPKVLFVHRNLEDASHSLYEKRGHVADPRNGETWAHAVQSFNLWNQHKAMHACVTNHVAHTTFSFQQLTRMTDVCTQLLAEFAEVPFNPEAANMVDRSLHVA